MRRFITKPNSKIDNRILLFFNIFAYFCVSCLLCSYITTKWIELISEFIITIIIVFITVILYHRKYDQTIVILRLRNKVSAYLSDSYIIELDRQYFDIPKACKIINEICNATIVPIDERKPLYETMCQIWTVCGGGHIYKVYTVPYFISERWKKAVVEYKKYEIEND